MAAATRDATADLTEAALQGAAGFEFGQLVRLLRRQARRDGLDPDNALRFRPALGLDLPRARVVEAKHSEEGGGTISPPPSLGSTAWRRRCPRSIRRI